MRMGIHHFLNDLKLKSGVGKGVVLLGLCVLLGACNINGGAISPTIIIVIPTNTLAPLITQTPRFTATPIPSPTPPIIPTQVAAVPTLVTPEPNAIQPLPPSITPTATKVVQGLTKDQANLRAGPGANFRIVGTLKTGSSMSVLSYSADNKWALIQLEDGTEGWISAPLFTLTNPSATVPVLSAADLTQRAQLGTAIALTAKAILPTAEGGVTVDSAAATHVPRIDRATDVLAYCDQAKDAVRNKKFVVGQKVFVFWSWIAKTPEQMKDHLNNAIYLVKVNDQVIGDWARYSSPVIKQSDNSYITYWFIPLGTPNGGTYKIDFNLTWKAAINDGEFNFGPGTDKPSDTGTCSFSVTAK